MDYTTILINHMVNNDLKYSQHVRWEDLVTLSEFEGEERGDHANSHYYSYYFLGATARYLQRLYDNAVSCTKKKYGLSKEEVSSDIVLKWLQERTPRQKRKKRIERDEKIIQFYQILRKEREN